MRCVGGLCGRKTEVLEYQYVLYTYSPPPTHRDFTFNRRGTLSNSLTITTLLSVLGVCRDRFEAFGGFKVTSGAAGSG